MSDDKKQEARTILGIFSKRKKSEPVENSDFNTRYESELTKLISNYQTSQQEALAWKNRIRIGLVTVCILLLLSPIMIVMYCLYLVSNGLVAENSYAVIGGFLSSIIGFVSNVKLLIEIAAKYVFDEKESENVLALFKHAEQHLKK